MKTLDRIIKFTQINPNPADTGCGDVYPLVSTDFNPVHGSGTPDVNKTASLALAHQTSRGHLHEHKKTREVYICVDGQGSVDWASDTTCSIKEGDGVDIAPGTLHGLNAAPGKSVQVLVVSHPKFDPTDHYKVSSNTKRTEKKPPFFISDTSNYFGTLVTHPHLIIRRMQITEKPHIADDQQLLFVVRGTGIFKVNKFKTSIEKYDSIAMQPGDTINSATSEPLVVITAHVK